MDADERDKLAEFLIKNVDVFAWKSYNMPRIPIDVMCHKLHISPSYKPVKQKPRRSAPEEAKAIEEEI